MPRLRTKKGSKIVSTEQPSIGGTIIPYMQARADTGGAGVISRGYNDDLVLWSQDQAFALRNAARVVPNVAIDWENVAEEIEALGQSEVGNLESRIGTIIEHLIKLEASPAADPRNKWKATIRNARTEIKRVLKRSPHLKNKVPEIVADEAPEARTNAAGSLEDYGEQPRVDIKGLNFTPEQILGDWFPDS